MDQTTSKLFRDVATYGRYYNLNQNTYLERVNHMNYYCDRCHRTNIREFYGHGDYDICLSCYNQIISNEQYQPLTSNSSHHSTYMEESPFRPLPVTRMMESAILPQPQLQPASDQFTKIRNEMQRLIDEVYPNFPNVNQLFTRINKLEWFSFLNHMIENWTSVRIDDVYRLKQFFNNVHPEAYRINFRSKIRDTSMAVTFRPKGTDSFELFYNHQPIGAIKIALDGNLYYELNNNNNYASRIIDEPISLMMESMFYK